MKHILALILLFFSFNIHGIDPIYITKGNTQAIPIAINYFKVNDKEKEAALQIIDIISNDLNHSGLFRSINQDAFIDNLYGFDTKPNFSSWKTINANFLINGSVEKKGTNKLSVKIVLWDIYNEKNILSTEYESQYAGMRKLAHKISDQIFETITGERGYFSTQIFYISESGSAKKKVKRIAKMDYDGANHKFITDGKKMSLTPRLSPKGDKMLYLSYEGKIPKVVLHDLQTGKKAIVGNFSGMSFAPRFSPNENKALISIAKNGNTDIYEINFDSKSMRRLTNDNAINTSPSYSPDGKEIVFNSDREGSGLLYIMNSDGTNIRKISFGGGTYGSPLWSPNGNYIAFTKISRDLGFSIGVMRPDGSGERILTNGYLVESPTWSPSGRYILFTRSGKQDQNGMAKSKIYSIDISGNNERQVPTPLDASDPEWSSLID
jgi:TolB protein